jgi:hypothetical protein
MGPDAVAALVEGCIPFIGGIVATLYGYRILGKTPGQDPRFDGWHAKWGRMLKVLGPLVALFGVLLATQGLLRARS